MQRSGSPLVLFLTQYKAILHWGVGMGCVLLFCFCCWPRLQPQPVDRPTDIEDLPETEEAT